MRISIYPMGTKDLEEVISIETRVFPKPWKLRDFEWEIRHNMLAIYRVGRFEDSIVGYGGLWLTLREAHLTTLAVHPEYRSRGVGTYLLNYFQMLASIKGASLMTLEVRISNERAQRFYSRNGFSIRAIHPNYYSDEDAYIMQARLDRRQKMPDSK